MLETSGGNKIVNNTNFSLLNLVFSCFELQHAPSQNLEPKCSTKKFVLIFLLVSLLHISGIKKSYKKI